MLINILVSIISTFVVPFIAIMGYLGFWDFVSRFLDLNAYVCMTLTVCFELFLLYIIGILFIRSTGKLIKDIVSIGISGILLFIYLQMAGSGPMPWDPDLGADLSVAGFFFVCSFVPSLFLWLGMFSRKKNRDKLKEAKTKRKLTQAAAEDGGQDEIPPAE